MRTTTPPKLIAVSGACHQAKGELLNVRTESEIKALTRKVQVICDH